MTPRRPRLPTDKDLSAFRTLIRRANEAAERPDQTRAANLDRAACKAARAVMPVTEQQRRDGPFHLLVKLGQGYLRRSPEARAEASAELTELARRCALILTEPGARERADLVG